MTATRLGNLKQTEIRNMSQLQNAIDSQVLTISPFKVKALKHGASQSQRIATLMPPTDRKLFPHRSQERRSPNDGDQVAIHRRKRCTRQLKRRWRSIGQRLQPQEGRSIGKEAARVEAICAEVRYQRKSLRGPEKPATSEGA